MLTAGDDLAKTLAKSQKVTFWSKKNSFIYFWKTIYIKYLYIFWQTKIKYLFSMCIYIYNITNIKLNILNLILTFKKI